MEQVITEEMRLLIKVAIDDLKFLLEEVQELRPGSYRATSTIHKLEQIVAETTGKG